MVEDRLTLVVSSSESVDALWFALTDGRGAWWPELTLTAAVGASVRETWTEDGHERYADGRVTEVAAPKTLGFEWQQPTWPRPLRVRFRIERISRGSTVTLTEQGFADQPNGQALRAAHEDGWTFHLANLLEAATRPFYASGQASVPRISTEREFLGAPRSSALKQVKQPRDCCNEADDTKAGS